MSWIDLRYRYFAALCSDCKVELIGWSWMETCVCAKLGVEMCLYILLLVEGLVIT